MKRKIYYLLILIVSLYIGLLYHYPQVRFLIALELVLPVVSLLGLIVGGGRCEIRIMCDKPTCTRQEQAGLTVAVRNYSFFPVALAVVYLEWEEAGTGKRRKQKLRSGIAGKRQARFQVPLNTEHCGSVTLRVRKLKLYDNLQLWSKTKKQSLEETVFVLPSIEILEIDMKGCREETESNLYAASVQSMEGYQIRQYQAGDHLHRIHWKLSAREDTLQVKDFEKRTGGRTRLLLDFYHTGAAGMCPEQWDAYLDIASSLLFAMCREDEQGLEVMWYDRGGELECVTVRREQDIWDCLIMLLTVKIWVKPFLPEAFSGEMPGMEEMFWLTAERELYRGGSLILSFSGREGVSTDQKKKERAVV